MKSILLIVLTVFAVLIASSLPSSAREKQPVPVDAGSAFLNLPGPNAASAQAGPNRATAATQDIAIVSFNGPAQATQGDDISDVTTLTLINNGDTTIPASTFYVRFLLSPDADITIDDQRVELVRIEDELPAGVPVTVNLSPQGAGVRIHLYATTGAQYLGVYADVPTAPDIEPYGEVIETDETNNTAAIPITILEIQKSTVYYEDFQAGAGGWEPFDYTVQDIHWQRTADPYGGTTGTVWWCGDNNADWADPLGYGNNWNQFLEKSVAVDPAAPTMRYVFRYDTEPGYDYVHVEASDDGGSNWVTLPRLSDGLPATYDGSSGGFIQDSVDLSSFTQGLIKVRFRFSSDGAWSDEDGLFYSDGAVLIDEVEVSNLGVDDFETGDDGWVAKVPPPAGGAFRLEYEPPFDVPDTTYVPQLCNTWVAYDPQTGVFPFGADHSQVGPHIGIESPAIPIPPDAQNLVLRFDLYGYLPLDNLVFYQWEISDNLNGVWRNDNFVYYDNNATWSRRYFELTDYITPGATSIRVRLIGRDMCDVYCGNIGTGSAHTAAPYFDNVEVVATVTTTPGIDLALYPRECGASESDTDGDGVIDTADLCPLENALYYDRDGDGCLDDVITGRHIEYWDANDLPLEYVIHEDGAPGILDGSEFLALEAAMNAWTTIPGAEVSVDYLGTTPQSEASALDGVNLITFADKDFAFPSGVLAVGITTSYNFPTDVNGTTYRPGQIIDADMIFNPVEDFRTESAGTGVDIQSVATHEAGHMFGISHSAIRSATMFYVLPPELEARSLESDDRMVALAAYPDANTLANGTRLSGKVVDGRTGEPVPGVIVFVTDAATGDTTACTYTMPAGGPRPGTFDFVGLPAGDYHVSIHPLDGSSQVKGLSPININRLIYASAVINVIPEYWDVGEGTSEDPSARSPVTLAGGTPVTVNFQTNLDLTGPSVVNLYPTGSTTAAGIDAAVLIDFDEPVDGNSFSASTFALRDGAGTAVSGAGALLNEDRTFLFVPDNNLAFASTYSVELTDGITDPFGNTLTTPLDFSFTTEVQPSVSISNLTPNKGPAESIVVINGAGFNADPGGNTVTFGATVTPVSRATISELVVSVPSGMEPGVVEVRVRNEDTPAVISNPLTFTVLAPEEVARGYETGDAVTVGIPRSIEVTPDGSRAFVATAQGVTAVSVGGGTGTSSTTAIDVVGGVDDLDVTPDGKLVYAVSDYNTGLYTINADISTGAIGLLRSTPVPEGPRGIVIDPAGRRAYICVAASATQPPGIQIWDVVRNSGTFERQVGFMETPDPNLTGRMAVDPAGSYLLAPSANGTLLVFNLATGSFQQEIAVQADPQDVLVDPAGQRAYVTDGEGYVSIVGLSSMQKIRDITTGGSIRGAAMTAAGAYIYAADYQLDFLTVIDLVEDSPTYRTVKSRISQPGNPVDVVFSPDGTYAYSIVEENTRVMVTTVGIGPTLRTVTPRAGREGARVVLSGFDFTGYDATTVSFDGVSVTPEQLSDGVIVASVPAGARSGPLTVVGTRAGEPDEVSNPVYFEVLGPTAPGAIRLASSAPVPGASPEVTGTMAVSPDGGRVLVGDATAVHLFDSGPYNATYNSFIGSLPTLSGALEDIVITPDGRRAFVSSGSTPVSVIDLSPGGLAEAALLDYGTDVSALAVTPDGRHLLAAAPGAASIYVVDIADAAMPAVATVPVADGALGLNGEAGAIAIHPSGSHAYVAVSDDSPAAVVILDTDPASASFGTRVGTVVLPSAAPDEVPVSLSFAPDGSMCFVLTSQLTGTPHRTVVMLEITDPAAPVLSAITFSIDTAAAPGRESIRVSPRGDRAIVNIGEDGFIRLDITAAPNLTVLDTRPGTMHTGAVGFAFTPDGSGLFATSSATDELYAFDFKQGQQMVAAAGESRTGIAGEPLAGPVSVLVTEIASGDSTSGVPVTFTVADGGGHFATEDPAATPTTLVVPTGDDGFAAVKWVLGPVIGSQTVTASATDVSGSPLTFTATAVEDPETLPLELATVRPVSGASGVSVTTAVQATFSRAVDVDDLSSTAIFLSADGGVTAVPVIVGFGDGNRKVTLVPVGDLEYSTQYTIVVTRGVKDTSGSPLTNPAVQTFTTSARPGVTLSAVSPPDATPNTLVTLSGDGFDRDPEGNVVTFSGGATAAVVGSSSDYLSVRVPFGAETGPVQVQSFSAVSNTLPFTVLTPTSTTADDVVATIKTGSSTKSVTISPDGTIAYAVAPKANLLAVIDLVTFTLIKSVPVGDKPWAVTTSPDGSNVYVANILSGDVSVIDADPGSADYLKVSETLNVGANPIDLVATPDGDRVIVANAGSNDLSVVDSDANSESYHSVIATIKTGSSSRSVTVDPDGGRIFVGTNDGYLVLGSLDYGVIATIKSGSTSKSVTVSPDGTLLIFLSTLGEVSIYNIAPGSASENQVIATIKSGSTSKSVTVSPDGTLLFLVQEEGDAILVYSLEFKTSVSVLDPNAVVGDPVELELVKTIVVGENPEFIEFLPDGSGDFVVTRSGDNSLVVLSEAPQPVSASGRVYADCPDAQTGLLGVGIDFYDTDTATLLGTSYTDSAGYYWVDSLAAGDYVLTLLTPIGYTIPSEESPVSLAPGESGVIDFSLMCDQSPPDARKMSFWKHQLGLALLDRTSEVDAATLCSYLDEIAAHFNSNRMNPVVVYDPPASGQCHDKLQVAKDLLNLQGQLTELSKARQQLMALLFNVAGGKLRLNTIVSQDGATVSKAITYVDNLIDDGDDANDMTARKIARDINQGKMLPAGSIPLGLPEIAYSSAPKRFDLGQNYPNPFNPLTVIQYDVARPAHVRLRVFDVAGRLVRTLVDSGQKPGVYRVQWDGTNQQGVGVAAGIYFYRIEAGNYVKARKMLLLK